MVDRLTATNHRKISSTHPAVLAWIQLNSNNRRPKRVEIIRETHTSKASVYRLLQVGHRGTSVIAKCCQRKIALLDRTFYEDVLPYLPLPSANYYGYYDQDDQISWLFLEDVGTVRYSPQIEEHRDLATKWMGIFHTSTNLVPSAEHLPDRGIDYYFDHLLTGRGTIHSNLSNPALKKEDLILLRKIISQCDLLESNWSELRSICDTTPKTLTHGDFKKKNIYLRPSKNGDELIPLDWETAGIGILTTDIVEAKIDVESYWYCIRDFWPNLDLQTFLFFTEIGRIFRYLAAISWESQNLRYQWISKSMLKMDVYQTRIESALRTIHLDDKADAKS